MAEEEYMEEEMLEEEAPLTAEELFEQHKAEINAAFEEKGFFTRMGEMFSGLSKPKSSAEYKLAKTELQRLAAPLLAILLPTLGVTALIVITAITGQSKKVIQVDIAKVQDEEVELEEEKEPEPEEIIPPDEQVDVQVDTPVVGPVTDVVTPNATPTTEPVSVKPAAQDSVALIKSPIMMKSMAGSRSPGMRGAFLRGGGRYGDAETEGAVLKALRWLKKNQAAQGNWPGDIANTALAVLAYLAHGETPGSKEFGETVEKAIQYLIDAQTMDANGVCHFRGAGGTEYGYLICTYALAEAYGMTKNPNAKEAATIALQRIVSNQSPTGGWDYNMKKDSTRDDMSFEGWALQAIKAGKMAGLHPDGIDECIKKAIRCLKTRNFRNGGFNYTAGGNPTGLTATGCLAMQLLGYGNQHEVSQALDYMRDWKPTFDPKELSGKSQGSAPQYYCYYATQCKYQAGMKQGATKSDEKSWQDWNVAMKKLYPAIIIDDPTPVKDWKGKDHKQGHFENQDAHSSRPVMDTCLAALQLMVYYRYLPTTQTVKDTAGADDVGGAEAAIDKGNDVNVEVDI